VIEAVKSNVVQFPKEKQRHITTLARFVPNGYLTQAEKYVLLILATFANDEDEAWPSHAKLSDVYYGEIPGSVPENITRARSIQISKYMKKLKDKRMIFKIGKIGRTNKYQFNRQILEAFAQTHAAALSKENVGYDSH
jgi:hypothetical protein